MTIELSTLIAGTVAAASAGATSEGVLGVQDGTLKRFVPVQLGRAHRLYINASRALTLADSVYAPISSTSASTTTLTVPTFATLGFVRSAGDPIELLFILNRDGLGALLVAAAGGVTIEDPYGVLADIPRYGTVTLISRSTNIWVAQ